MNKLSVDDGGKTPPTDEELYGELAARLFSAFGSYQQGVKSVDHYRRTYTDTLPQPIGELWLALARDLQRAMAVRHGTGLV